MSSQWERFDRYYLRYPDLHFSLDISRVDFDENYFEGMNSRVERAFQAMQQLEKGAIANPDEKRMVGHYWLRAPELAPNSQVQALGSLKGKTATAGELAKAVQADTEDIFHVLTHLSAPGGKVVRHSGDRPSEDTFVLE
jgi:glucose-6-phosphate isomerase